MNDPIQVLREGFSKYQGDPRWLDFSEQHAALAQVEALVEAAKNAEDLWNLRMAGAAYVVPPRDDTDPITKAWYALNDALAPFKENP